MLLFVLLFCLYVKSLISPLDVRRQKDMNHYLAGTTHIFFFFSFLEFLSPPYAAPAGYCYKVPIGRVLSIGISESESNSIDLLPNIF